MALYVVYTTSHTGFMTSKHSIHDIKATLSHITPIISDSTSTVSFSSYPDYRSYNTHCMYDKQPQYVWHHMNYIWNHIHSLWYHTRLWHHIHCIHVITPSIPVIASTVAAALLRVYWLYHTYYMCDTNPVYVWHHMNSIWHHTHSLWHHNTVFMISHPLNSSQHTHSIWHHIPYTSQPLYLCQDTSYV